MRRAAERMNKAHRSLLMFQRLPFAVAASPRRRSQMGAPNDEQGPRRKAIDKRDRVGYRSVITLPGSFDGRHRMGNRTQTLA